jgi:hypothetical protein
MKYLVLSVVACLYSLTLLSQKEFNVACIAFYNVENLFDTLDSPDTEDFEFTPAGPNHYNSKVYYDKLSHLSKVISELGTEYTPDGAAILGVSEIENRTVLEDLIKQPALAARGYKIIHQDSKDGRGVDVGFIYQPKYFTPDTTLFISLQTNDPGDPTRFSRDILIAIGKLEGERIAITVNHWPSRRGGEQTTAHLRNQAAMINRAVLDSLKTNCHIEKAIVMGDLNDDPINDSVRKYLKSGRALNELKGKEMFNPMEDYYRKGLGTTAYQDAWSLFDQIILSTDLAVNTTGLHFYKAFVYSPLYMTQKTGAFKGYPMRTYANGVYAGGYSDHFPVYVLLVKEKA